MKLFYDFTEGDSVTGGGMETVTQSSHIKRLGYRGHFWECNPVYSTKVLLNTV